MASIFPEDMTMPPSGMTQRAESFVLNPKMQPSSSPFIVSGVSESQSRTDKKRAPEEARFEVSLVSGSKSSSRATSRQIGRGAGICRKQISHGKASALKPIGI